MLELRYFISVGNFSNSILGSSNGISPTIGSTKVTDVDTTGNRTNVPVLIVCIASYVSSVLQRELTT